jgi:hypothetical protein
MEENLFIHANEDSVQQTWHKTADVLQHVSSTYLNTHSLIILVFSIVVALAAGRLMATFLRKAVAVIGNRADKSQNLYTVNRLRRYETVLVLSIAALRTILVLFAILVGVCPSIWPSAWNNWCQCFITGCYWWCAGASAT